MAALTQRGRRVNEPISVPVMQHGFFPKAFVWRGQRHDVHAVEDCRTEVRRSWQGQVERHCFRVRAEDDIFELAQDLARDTWELERVWSND
jgi:hypothetical protein